MTARLRAITAFCLTTAMPERLAHFYTGLGFTAGAPIPIPAREMELLGLAGGGIRLPLRLGAQRIDLDSFERRGRRYPADADAADLCFQHFALVTDDAEASWLRARSLGATEISRGGPVALPAAAGSVTAVKFRDPEGHPLELLQFPPGAGRHGTGLLGIDHTAISVADAAASQRFYAAHGLAAGHPTRNQGPTQAVLDGLGRVEVDVVPMLPEQARPHLELLGYRTPRGRPAPPAAANDVAATRIIWAADRDALLRDPDGHLHLCVGDARRFGGHAG
ncbi:MAG TPA: VOC family protein [Roseomonas sp.]|jgi:catechol 2,3-dioxygenase-like lactoylglutathione lyase family enzyme